MKKLWFFLIIGIIVFSYSCTYNKADILYPKVNACDTTSIVSYQNSVVPIFQAQCYGCHIKGRAYGGIEMGTYDADKVLALNGKLWGSVSHGSGYFFMPKNKDALSSCQMAFIKKWITEGAPNN